MIIVKCGCSRYIHVFPSYSEVCPFCGKSISLLSNAGDKTETQQKREFLSAEEAKHWQENERGAKIVTGGLFDNPLSFLNETVSEIDSCITAGQFSKALYLIDKVLEWVPGRSEIYWRRLLASENCKTDMDLLRKGKILHNNTAFINAAKFANDNELPVYELIEKAESLAVTLLEKALAEQELHDKRNTNAEKLLYEYGQQLKRHEGVAQENISQLEEIERLIHEQAIDCETITGEYRYALADILTASRTVGNHSENEITYDKKAAWESQLDMICSASMNEINQLKEVISSHSAFGNQNNLVQKQNAAKSKINGNISDINAIYRQIQNTVNFIEDISYKYTKARKAINLGSYSETAGLLSERFNEIIKQAMDRTSGDVN